MLHIQRLIHQRKNDEIEVDDEVDDDLIHFHQIHSIHQQTILKISQKINQKINRQIRLRQILLLEIHDDSQIHNTNKKLSMPISGLMKIALLSMILSKKLDYLIH